MRGALIAVLALFVVAPAPSYSAPVNIFTSIWSQLSYLYDPSAWADAETKLPAACYQLKDDKILVNEYAVSEYYTEMSDFCGTLYNEAYTGYVELLAALNSGKICNERGGPLAQSLHDALRGFQNQVVDDYDFRSGRDDKRSMAQAEIDLDRVRRARTIQFLLDETYIWEQVQQLLPKIHPEHPIAL